MPPPTEITQRPERVLDFIVLDAIMEEENTQTQSNSAPTVCVGELNPIRYRGKYYDAETGFYWLMTRYYNPEWRRFINADVLFIAGCPLTAVNMYAYCNGNPVMLIDPTGMYATIIEIITFIIGMFMLAEVLFYVGFPIDEIVNFIDAVGVFIETNEFNPLESIMAVFGFIDEFIQLLGGGDGSVVPIWSEDFSNALAAGFFGGGIGAMTGMLAPPFGPAIGFLSGFLIGFVGYYVGS